MKKIFILAVVLLSLTACSSAFNQTNTYYEENYVEPTTDIDEIKKFQNDYYTSEEVDEKSKNFYETAVLNEYNNSPEDPLFLKYAEYQMYSVGEEFSFPNAELIKGSPINQYGNVFNFIVNDISIYDSVFDAGYDKQTVENKNVSALTEDGTVKNDWDLVGISLEVSGNGLFYPFYFDLINSTDKEQESERNFSPLFIFEGSLSGDISVRANNPMNIIVWFLVDTKQYDYDNLYFCTGVQSINSAKSFVPLGDILGDGEANDGVSDEYIETLEKYFYADDTDPRARQYYESVKEDIISDEYTDLILEKYQYQVYTAKKDESLKMTFPFEELINTDPKSYENNHIKFTLSDIKLFENKKEQYDYYNKISPQSNSQFSEMYDLLLENASNSFDKAYYQEQLTMINKNGDLLDENGEISDSHIIVAVFWDILSLKFTDIKFTLQDNIQLYYIPDKEVEPISLQEYVFSPNGPTRSFYLEDQYSMPTISEWIIDSEKYPLEYLYISIDCNENKNYKKSFVSLADLFEE